MICPHCGQRLTPSDHSIIVEEWNPWYTFRITARTADDLPTVLWKNLFRALGLARYQIGRMKAALHGPSDEPGEGGEK
jgi:hypothetical protein